MMLTYFFRVFNRDRDIKFVLLLFFFFFIQLKEKKIKKFWRKFAWTPNSKIFFAQQNEGLLSTKILKLY